MLRVLMLWLVLAATAGCHAPKAEVNAPSDRVHIFYYNWYGAPPQQDAYVHWQQGGHVPPESIGANYYPVLGAYSSSDPAVLKQHMVWIRESGASVITLTWWGLGSYEDRHAGLVLDAAAAAGLKVNFHLEPYAGMTPQRLEQDIRHLLDRFGNHPALYRAKNHANRPVFYVFESLRHDAAVWRKTTDRLRASDRPVILLAQTTDLSFVMNAGFDGGYTYDVLAPFKDPTYLDRWPQLAKAFGDAGKIFVPSVGPGYHDDRAVPKGANEPETARTRDAGSDATYRRAWAMAGQSGSEFVTLTSFNEWHEGTQIEPAVAKSIPGFEYRGYARGPRHYLDLTAQLARQFARTRPAINQPRAKSP